MAGNSRIECLSQDLVHDYYHGVQSSALHTVSPIITYSNTGRSNWSLPRLLFHLPTAEIIPTF
jgi:hypothetical protein